MSIRTLATSPLSLLMLFVPMFPVYVNFSLHVLILNTGLKTPAIIWDPAFNRSFRVIEDIGGNMLGSVPLVDQRQSLWSDDLGGRS